VADDYEIQRACMELEGAAGRIRSTADLDAAIRAAKGVRWAAIFTELRLRSLRRRRRAAARKASKKPSDA
jgi:hypothetical protein